MKVYFHRNFNKSYKKCSVKIKDQFKKRLKIFLADPNNVILENHPLRGKWQKFRSINITGDYRAIYIYLSEQEVEFFTIGTHSYLYD
ncbi:MAG: hypothetical protein COV57_00390 [Candidatus Liptonbacteria bacterium CG11_big_fil_rev_8_21_14_0_20_35_14]|uniref:Type II toxin-antitoxin system mRNA interferase toxin, RelE/StbE family n=1 Tax=Candidatus Liptonbacteria bacterium CG11_big_fil_rev_8_21_14_0_20_35_14 TaxID=1974634 RepID=A0A2H0N8I5_9BACT|nr:MAG: hypothetical protein COV57_00390 [Candidatus Liptonbacteria bacterium CG11_big_fil_rev_8_21_14_0_20_35_14]